MIGAQVMEIEQLRADVERAVREQFPDRSEAMLREMELIGSWRWRGVKDTAALRKMMSLRADALLLSVSSTIWSPPRREGTIVPGATITVGRDLANLPDSIMSVPGRIRHGTTMALLCVTIVVLGDPPLDSWSFGLKINGGYASDGGKPFDRVDVASMTRGIDLPVPLVFRGDDDLNMELRHHGARVAKNEYQFGVRLDGVMHSARWS